MNENMIKMFQVLSSTSLKSLGGRLLSNEEWELLRNNNDFSNIESFMYGVFLGQHYIVLSMNEFINHFTRYDRNFNIVDEHRLNDGNFDLENFIHTLKSDIEKENNEFKMTFFEKFSEGFRNKQSMSTEESLNSFVAFGVGFHVEIKRNKKNEFTIKGYNLLRNNENKVVFEETYTNYNDFYFFEEMLDKFLLVVKNLSKFSIAYRNSCALLLSVGFENIEDFDIENLLLEKTTDIFLTKNMTFFYLNKPNTTIIFDYVNNHVLVNKNNEQIYKGKLIFVSLVQEDRDSFKSVLRKNF